MTKHILNLSELLKKGFKIKKLGTSSILFEFGSGIKILYNDYPERLKDLSISISNNNDWIFRRSFLPPPPLTMSQEVYRESVNWKVSNW